MEFPPIFLLPTHLDPGLLHNLEGKIPSLTYDINEAEVVIGNIITPERAQFELRHRKVVTEPTGEILTHRPSAKRRKLSAGATHNFRPDIETADHLAQETSDLETIKVVKLAWLTDSLSENKILPLTDYIIYEGRRTSHATHPSQAGPRIISRALDDASSVPDMAPYPKSSRRIQPGRMELRTYASPQVPALLRHMTSEQEAESASSIPAFLRTTYSCERPTPADSPNEDFVEELKKIRTTRLLIGDQIGVRAYSTSIATLAACPYKLSSPAEVANLPGCGAKIIELYQEWKTTDRLKEARDAERDPKLSVLRLFYDIWGVGDTTAREFYNKGWKDLDDLVEYAWPSLSRVQQIGVKFYDDFKLKIPRFEVESVGSTILEHARRFSVDFQMTIVGGYRRGKRESGDVDVIVSHPDEAETHNFIEKLVLSLEKAGFITHTLTLSNRNSERGQTPLAWKGSERKGSGFDTLDKAMVVWRQPISGPEKEQSPHRRVDIIVSPWKTVGCALLGWSGGTTFQRDLRRYCKKEKNLKFDSSGIRSQVDGTWADFEGGELGRAPDMLAAEKRVFHGLGLEWRAPEDRCTG